MTPETDTPAKPIKPTRPQREILAVVRDQDVRRYAREKFTRSGSTVVFYWATDLGDGYSGSELSERVISKMLDRGWVESRFPDRKPTSMRDMIKWQTEATLHITPAGLEFL